MDYCAAERLTLGRRRPAKESDQAAHEQQHRCIRRLGAWLGQQGWQERPPLGRPSCRSCS